MIAAILSLTVHLAGPIAGAVYLSRMLRTGGPRRLWAHAGVTILVLLAIALWAPRLTLVNQGPRAMAGVDTWVLPIAIAVIAGGLQLLGRLRTPPAVQVIVSSLAGIVAILSGSWET